MIADNQKLHAREPATKFRMYNWSFFIRHSKKNRDVLWDLGMSAHPEDFPPVIAKGPIIDAAIEAPFEPLEAQIMRRSGIAADQLHTIILSHAHFDHCRPVREIFPNATVFFGPGTAAYCSPGHLADPLSIWDGRYFDPDQATERWKTLDGPWVPFGPFDRAMDFFGDGCFWVIQAPGHMPGNLCACARLETGEWVLLGSDCCHSRCLRVNIQTDSRFNGLKRAILDGLKEFGRFEMPDGSTFCLHTDVAAARDTLARIRLMETELGVHVALAHDATWMQEGRNAVLLSLLDNKFRDNISHSLRREQPF